MKRNYFFFIMLTLALTHCSNLMDKYNEEDLLKKPSAVLVINGGDEFCYSRKVKLSFNLHRIDELRLNDDSTSWTDWMECLTQFDWTFDYVPGIKTVNLEALDVLGGNLLASDSITFIDRVTTTASFGLSFERFSSDADAALQTVVGGRYNSTYSCFSIYTRGAIDWNETMVMYPGSDSSARFGHSVSIDRSGSLLAVSAPFAAGNRGEVYLYEKESGGNWTQIRCLSKASALSGELFGYSVKVSPDGNTLLVGACGNGTSPQGFVKIYSRNQGGPDNWGESVTLSSSISNGRFAVSLDCSYDASVVVIGVPDYYDTTTGDYRYCGTVRVFRLSGGTYSEDILYDNTGTNIATALSQNDQFGYSVSCNAAGDYIAVGIPHAGMSSGKAWIFSWDTSSAQYRQLSSIAPSDLTGTENFGGAVKLSDDALHLAVSAPDTTTTRGSKAGRVYLYGSSAGTFSRVGTIDAADGSGGDMMGRQLMMGSDGSSIAASAPGDDIVSEEDNYGSVYIFRNAF